MYTRLAVFAALTAFAAAQSTTSTAASEGPTAVSDCHPHGDVQFCVAGGEEWEVTSDIDEANAPDEYSDCHAHDEEL